MSTKKCKHCQTEIDDKAKRCPHCQGDLRSWFARHPILTFLGFLFIFPFVIAGISQSPSQNNGKQSNISTPSPEAISSPQAISEEYKASLANILCQKRSDGVPYFDLQPIAKYFEDQKDTGKLIYNTTKKPSADDCRKVAEGCLKIWDKEQCEDIANKKIWIGMSELQLNLSLGNPNDKNNTTGSWGIHSQWVYGDPIYGANYVYLEGIDKSSMKVTSWQD